MSNFPAPVVSWNDIARVCRRICVLRERGQADEAERLRAGELMEMLATVRTADESEIATTERLNGIFATEAERVANAAVLAEMLLPMIADQLRTMVGSLTASSAAPAPAPSVAAPRVEKPATPRATSIADFIDEMIAQEKPPERPKHGAQRQAS